MSCDISARSIDIFDSKSWLVAYQHFISSKILLNWMTFLVFNNCKTFKQIALTQNQGLFTGISVITLVEVFYWGICFASVALGRLALKLRLRLKENYLFTMFGFTLANTNSTVDVGSVETNIGSEIGWKIFQWPRSFSSYLTVLTILNCQINGATLKWHHW